MKSYLHHRILMLYKSVKICLLNSQPSIQSPKSKALDAMYLHAQTFCTIADMIFIPMGAMYLYMQERFLHSLIRSHQFLP